MSPLYRWLLIALSTATATAQTWSPVLDVGLVHNDNVTNSSRQQKDDGATTITASLQRVRVLSRDWQGSLELGAETAFWRKYSGLNLSQLSARGGLRHKFGLGPYATKLDLDLQGYHQIADVREWSGNGYRASASLQKRFTSQWFGRLSADLNRFDADRAVYSGTVATLTAVVDYDLTPEWRLTASLRYGEGDQLSWCRESFPEFLGKGPQWKDGIFGGDWFPYNIEGNHRGAQIGVARALGPHSAISLNYDYSESRAPKNHLYLNHIVSFNFTHAF
ncbi:MAG: hypothetical protein ACN6I3_00105 [bacterium]